jgi:hypothetical protein
MVIFAVTINVFFFQRESLVIADKDSLFLFNFVKIYYYEKRN